jgi:hypothetical protein
MKKAKKNLTSGSSYTICPSTMLTILNEKKELNDIDTFSPNKKKLFWTCFLERQRVFGPLPAAVDAECAICLEPFHLIKQSVRRPELHTRCFSTCFSIDKTHVAWKSYHIRCLALYFVNALVFLEPTSRLPYCVEDIKRFQNAVWLSTSEVEGDEELIRFDYVKAFNCEKEAKTITFEEYFQMYINNLKNHWEVIKNRLLVISHETCSSHSVHVMSLSSVFRRFQRWVRTLKDYIMLLSVLKHIDLAKHCLAEIVQHTQTLKANLPEVIIRLLMQEYSSVLHGVLDFERRLIEQEQEQDGDEEEEEEVEGGEVSDDEDDEDGSEENVLE